jgi:ribonuclease P protein component
VYGFPKEYRLLKRFEFRRVENAGKRKRLDHVVVVFAENSGEYPRLGLVVSRRIGNAVIRNRVKRIIREFFRYHRLTLNPVDIVVIARKGADRPERELLFKELDTAFCWICSCTSDA